MKLWRGVNVYWTVVFIGLVILVNRWEFSPASHGVHVSKMLAYGILAIGAVLILFIQLAWRYYLAGKAKDQALEKRKQQSNPKELAKF